MSEAEQQSVAEAMGIKIGPTIIKVDSTLWNFNPNPAFDLARVSERENRITISSGDENLDLAFWQSHAQQFAEAA